MRPKFREMALELIFKSDKRQQFFYKYFTLVAPLEDINFRTLTAESIRLLFLPFLGRRAAKNIYITALGSTVDCTYSFRPKNFKFLFPQSGSPVQPHMTYLRGTL
jgi:hypothetical protein